MTLFIGVIVILGVLSWGVDSSWEWEIPQKWEAVIGGWKERLSNGTHSLNYDWYLGPENRELEKHLWHLTREFPRLNKKFKAPIKVEVCVYPYFPPDQNKRYIACLQRRFPELRIYESSLKEMRGQGHCFGCCESGDEGKDCKSVQQ